MTKLFPPNVQNCMSTSKLPLARGIPQSAPEHWESSIWGGKKPYQGGVLKSTCLWVSDLACALDWFYSPIYWWSLIICKVLN